jgi:anti-sigma factor RsiW
MNRPEDDELSAAERERFAALARERAPAAFLEERIVEAIRRDGALRVPWYRRSVPIPIAAAAGFLLFTLGAAAGRGVLSLVRTTERALPAAEARVIESPPAGRLVSWL